MPWSHDGRARAKLLGNVDGYVMALVDADAGYRATPHEHEHAEFYYLLSGEFRTRANT